MSTAGFTDATDGSPAGTLITWTAHDGDDNKSHIVHIDASGVSWVRSLKDQQEYGRLLAEVNTGTTDVASVLASHKKGRHLPADQLQSVSYSEPLNQLVITDHSGKKQKIAYGNDGEQQQIYEATNEYLGGKEREEEADAWSVMQGPLFATAVVAVIGGFFIWFASISEPNAEISGRRQGMKQLLNWIGYTIGPFWMSVMVGGLAAIILSFMTYTLINRPKRQVLEF